MWTTRLQVTAIQADFPHFCGSSFASPHPGYISCARNRKAHLQAAILGANSVVKQSRIFAGQSNWPESFLRFEALQPDMPFRCRRACWGGPHDAEPCLSIAVLQADDIAF